MTAESEMEKFTRHVGRVAQLVGQQRRRVESLKGTREFQGAAELLEQLETWLELHEEQLVILRELETERLPVGLSG
jgi:hypothetical protein